MSSLYSDMSRLCQICLARGADMSEQAGSCAMKKVDREPRR
jgi:hypothetical protein